MSKSIKRVIHVFLVLFLAVNILPFGEQQTYALVDPDVERAEIDVVYKYIDLTDPTLHREGIPQIKKDYDNNELMYSLRSVLKNIPWVRKIFIIMPNDKVRFLKAPEEISDKIVYVRDKDILGFDSSSCETFIWALWKLKEFGCSNHILFLNDDYFVGKPMKKSDFFYYDKDQGLLPYIFYNAPIKYTHKNEMNSLWKQLDKETTEYNEKKQDGALYKAQNACTYDFLYSVLNRDYLYVPVAERINSTIHNAMGFNLNEIKDIYDIVNSQYKYADISLRRRVGRSKLGVLMGSFYTFYYLNKENRKINQTVHYKYFDMAETGVNNNWDLFCINTRGVRPYTDLEYLKAKIKMEQLFPEPTKYERKDYNDWAGVDPALKERLKNEMSTQKVVNNYRPRRSFRLRKAG